MKESSVNTLLAHTAPFSSFSTAERDALAAAIVVHTCPPDTVILEQGNTLHDSVYVILSGQVRLIETTTEGVIRTFGEGKIFGYYGLLRDGPLPYQAEALTATDLALIPASLFHQLCNEHPRVLAFFESDISAYTRHHLTLYDLSGAQFLFGTRLSDLIHREPPRCSPNISVQQAAGIMCDQHCDYLVVMRESIPIGLLTDSDLRSKVVATAASPETPVSAVMNTELGVLNTRNSLYEALLMMLMRGLSHVLVCAEGNGPLRGVVSDNDITRSHGYNPMLLFNQVNQASSVEQLAELRCEANQLLLQLYRRGVRAQDLITINTLINDNLTGRVLSLSETALAESRPDIDLRWAWLSLGSEGRGEMSLKTDQDNALVYRAPNGDTAAAEHWLARWTDHVNQGLDQVGLALCEGEMMARNSLWRHSTAQWPQQFRDWLAHAKADQIMQIAAACDLRAVHGDLDLEQPVKAGLQQALQENPRFLQHMVRGVIANRPPLNNFLRRIRTLKTEQGRMINIKRRGLQPIIDFARILTLRVGFLDSSNTFDRLEYLQHAEPKLNNTLRDALETYRHLNDIRLGHHLHAVKMGVPADNWLSVDKLSDTQHEMLKAAFSAIESIQAVLAQRFGQSVR